MEEKKIKKYMVLGKNEYIDCDGSISNGPGLWYSDTLRGARNLATRHMYWDNRYGWTRPTIYRWHDKAWEYIEYNGDDYVW